MQNNINVSVSGPMQPTSTYKTVVLKGNHSFDSQVTEPNTKYVVKHNFDLDGGSVTIPQGCLLEFDGGSIANGTLVGQDTVLIYFQSLDEILPDIIREGSFVYNNTLSADEETLTEQGNLVKIKNKGVKSAHIDDAQILTQHINNGSVTGAKLNENVADNEDIYLTANKTLQLKDKDYDAEGFSGLGRVYLRKNIVNGKNVLTQSMLNKANTIYVIQYDYELGNEQVTNHIGESHITINATTYYYAAAQVIPVNYTAKAPNGYTFLKLNPQIPGSAEVLGDTVTANTDNFEVHVASAVSYNIDVTYDILSTPITIPENCVLKFDGGSLSGGTIVLNNVFIDAPSYTIFYNMNFQNSIINDSFNVLWIDGSDIGEKVNKANVRFKKLYIPYGTYTFITPIVVEAIRKLQMDGVYSYNGNISNGLCLIKVTNSPCCDVRIGEVYLTSRVQNLMGYGNDRTVNVIGVNFNACTSSRFFVWLL